MAAVLGVSQQTYCKYETGKIVPTKDIQVRIAAILGATVDECFPAQVAA
jgi:DNA-binding XRE family transcriptional regulator